MIDFKGLRRFLSFNHQHRATPKANPLTPDEAANALTPDEAANPLRPDEAVGQLISRYIREGRLPEALAAHQKALEAVPHYSFFQRSVRLALFEAVGDEASAHAVRVEIVRARIEEAEWYDEKLVPRKATIIAKAQAELDSLLAMKVGV